MKYILYEIVLKMILRDANKGKIFLNGKQKTMFGALILNFHNRRI